MQKLAAWKAVRRTRVTLLMNISGVGSENPTPSSIGELPPPNWPRKVRYSLIVVRKLTAARVTHGK